MPGTYDLYVKAINSAGCQSPLVNIHFVVNASPVITQFAAAQQTIVQGNPVTFAIAGTGYTQWRLLFNGTQVSPSGSGYNTGAVSNYILTQSVQPNQQGTYTLEITNGTCTATKDFNLYILPTVVITHDRTDKIGLDNGQTKVILHQHDKITFSSNVDSNAYNELWTYGDGFNNTTVTGQHYYNNAGQFNASLSLTNKATGEKFSFPYSLPILVLPEDNVVTVDGGINAPNTEYLIYPNPFKEFFKLRYTANSGERLTLRIYDLRGVSLFNESWIADGATNVRTFYNPIISAPSAVYVVHVHNETQKTIQKIKVIKQ